MRRWLFRLLLLLILGASPRPIVQAVAPVVFSEHSIAFSGAVDSEMALQFSIGFPQLTPDETGSIYVFINSPGGNIVEGKLMAGLIEQSDARTVCVVTGEAQSMGFYILQACSVRVAVPTATLMIHEPSILLPGILVPVNRHLAREMADELDKMSIEVGDYCSRRLYIPRALYDAQVNDKDWTMTPEVALLVGAIDAIVEPPPGP